VERSAAERCAAVDITKRPITYRARHKFDEQDHPKVGRSRSPLHHNNADVLHMLASAIGQAVRNLESTGSLTEESPALEREPVNESRSQIRAGSPFRWRVPLHKIARRRLPDREWLAH
jgi:phytoene dehydrogenase-like protein